MAQTTLGGKVTDSATQAAIYGASVWWGWGYTTTTGSDGRWSMQISTNDCGYSKTLEVSATGYTTYTSFPDVYVACGTSTEKNVSLQSSGDTQNPTVSITAPSCGTTYSSAQNVTITATATDNKGVTRVEFYLNGSMMRSVTSPPYTCPWQISASDLCGGTQVWTAYAYDAAGNYGSAYCSFYVQDTVAPTASITSPANNTTFNNCATTVPITATASDNCGISSVGFYKAVGGGFVYQGAGVNSGSSWTYSWPITSADNGTYFWRVTASDTHGNQVTSSSITLNVSLSTVAPTVAITSPANGTSYTTTSTDSRTVNITATATDPKGITQVVFYDGATAKGTVTSAPYTYNWTFTRTNEGVHTWTARAYDCVGNSAASSAVNLTVTAPPMVVSPPASQTVGMGSNATFSVTATGTAPLAYQWLFNGTPLAGKTSATLVLPAVDSSSAGSYSVTVTNAFGSATSSAATLSVVYFAVYVNRAYTGTPSDGSLQRPYKTVTTGYQAAQPNNIITIFSGNYNESVRMDKRLVLSATNGTVNIIGLP